MTQLLRNYYMSHLCYFVGELRVNSYVHLVAQFKPKLYTCTCEQCITCACYVYLDGHLLCVICARYNT